MLKRLADQQAIFAVNLLVILLAELERHRLQVKQASRRIIAATLSAHRARLAAKGKFNAKKILCL
ncbi:MAG: hypothetical protein ACR5K4_03735 [Sodalis sp. (in: enterobacteria)]